jgi:FlaA1/EpsC-like NDP-sugar epimerase
VYTGTRPGEKLFEELFIDGETYVRTAHEKIFLVQNATATAFDGLDAGLAKLAQAAQRNDRAAIIGGLAALVPEFASGSDTSGPG